jgi:hypothetical protein
MNAITSHGLLMPSIAEPMKPHPKKADRDHVSSSSNIQEQRNKLKL